MEAHRLNLLPLLKKQWGTDRLQYLQQIGNIAQQLGTPAYLVGGAVRDLFLQRDAPDLDVAVEGDVRSLAEACKAQIPGGDYQYHARFGTATLQDSQGFSLDLAQCRVEHYPAPAALPEVRPGDIDEDLIRRDFTINAMALPLDPENFATLLDPYGGRIDLQRGQLRTLHSRSFWDDPTRILRGLRFATRFQMNLVPESRQQLQDALQDDIFARLSAARLWREIRYLLELDALPQALSLLSEWNLWFLLRPVPMDIHAMQALLGRGQEQIQWLQQQFPEENIAVSTLMLILLWQDLSWTEIQRTLDQWPIPDRNRLEADLRILPDLPRRIAQAIRPSQRANIWQACSLAGILAAMAINPHDRAVTDSARLYLQEQKSLQPVFNGQELQTLGLSAGPSLGDILKRLRDAQLDRDIADKETAQQWLIKQGILPTNPR